MGNGIADGTFALNGGSADGFTLSTGADGDTILTATNTLLASTNLSESWQSSSSWAGGTVPGSAASPTVGLGATTPFVLNTGSSAVTTGNIGIYSPDAPLSITSNFTVGNGEINSYGGTLAVNPGATLTAGALVAHGGASSMTIDAGATVDLARRMNANLGPSAGVWTMAPGGDPYALTLSAGTATVAGSLLAGPTANQRGGVTRIAYDSAGQPALMMVTGTMTDTRTLLGSDATSSGRLIVSGPSASYTDFIDNADTYNSRGYITVGNNDLAPNTPSGLPIPPDIDPGQLIITNSAMMTEQESATIGSSIGSAGQVTVSAGGIWSLGANGLGFLNVGNAGAGSLLVSGGTVDIGNVGTFIQNGTKFTGGGMGIGSSSTGSGTLTVNGPGSYLLNLGAMGVGKGVPALWTF